LIQDCPPIDGLLREVLIELFPAHHDRDTEVLPDLDRMFPVMDADAETFSLNEVGRQGKAEVDERPCRQGAAAGFGPGEGLPLEEESAKTGLRAGAGARRACGAGACNDDVIKFSSQ
jgi:hypothetical protein